VAADAPEPAHGLVKSFEGEGSIADWAFTYEQSLAVQAYANFSDFERAKKILEFFDGEPRERRMFFNAYNANNGKPQRMRPIADRTSG